MKMSKIPIPESTMLVEIAYSGTQAVVYFLNENYRNGANILTYAKKILRKSGLCDDSIPVRENGIVYEGETDFTNLKGWISSQGEFKDWAILCSTNTDIAYIIELCNKNNIRLSKGIFLKRN